MDKYHWKERFKISKIAKFESDLLKTNEDIASQSREILQTFVWWGEQTCHPTPPPPPLSPPHHTNERLQSLLKAISSLA